MSVRGCWVVLHTRRGTRSSLTSHTRAFPRASLKTRVTRRHKHKRRSVGTLRQRELKAAARAHDYNARRLEVSHTRGQVACISFQSDRSACANTRQNIDSAGTLTHILAITRFRHVIHFRDKTHVHTCTHTVSCTHVPKHCIAPTIPTSTSIGTNLTIETHLHSQNPQTHGQTDTTNDTTPQLNT